MLKMTWFSVVFVVILGFISLVRYTDEIQYPEYGYSTEGVSDFGQRNKRQEFVVNSLSTEDNGVRLLQELPMMVVVLNEIQLCAGIAINERIIVASAVCARNINLTVAILTKTNFPKVKDHAGYLFNDNLNELQYRVSHVIKHPDFNETRKTYDIAVLKLTEPIDIAVPSCLWLDNNKIPSKTIIVEWSYWYTKSFSRKRLQNIMDNNDCMRNVPPEVKYVIGAYHICAFAQENSLSYENYNGPLYTELVYDGYNIPYVIGYRSLYLYGAYELIIFVKVSNFVEWIKEAIQELGEKVPSTLLDPLACAKEHLEHHRKINGSLPLVKNETIAFMVQIQANPGTDPNSNCAGTLIKKDMVVTLAQCAENLIPLASSVIMSDSSNITIRDIFIHPEYVKDSYYNNIALLKLSVETSSIKPAILEYFYIRDYEELSLFGNQRNEQFKDSTDLPVKANGLLIVLNHKCNPTEEQRLQLAQGLQFEHACLQNDQFLVPGSCEAVPGSPVVLSDDIGSSPGLYMSGRNCGFGEPAIVVLFMTHKTWLNSIIEAPPREPVVYTIPNLKFSDKCIYPDGTEGKCVTQSACNTYERVRNNLPLFFCEIKSVVCCPHSNIEDEFTFAINRS